MVEHAGFLSRAGALYLNQTSRRSIPPRYRSIYRGVMSTNVPRTGEGMARCGRGDADGSKPKREFDKLRLLVSSSSATRQIELLPFTGSVVTGRREASWQAVAGAGSRRAERYKRRGECGLGRFGSMAGTDFHRGGCKWAARRTDGTGERPACVSSNGEPPLSGTWTYFLPGTLRYRTTLSSVSGCLVCLAVGERAAHFLVALAQRTPACRLLSWVACLEPYAARRRLRPPCSFVCGDAARLFHTHLTANNQF